MEVPFLFFKNNCFASAIMESNSQAWTFEWHKNLKCLLGDEVCRYLSLYSIPNEFLLTVVVPIFNEERYLEASIARLCELPIGKEIILVDDCSNDSTPAIVEKLKSELSSDLNSFVVATHEVNRGKGCCAANRI